MHECMWLPRQLKGSLKIVCALQYSVLSLSATSRVMEAIKQLVN